MKFLSAELYLPSPEYVTETSYAPYPSPGIVIITSPFSTGL